MQQNESVKFNLIENIIALCKKKGITLSALERNVGFSNYTIAKWKNCSPRVENLKKVADYFGVSVDALLTDQVNK